MNYIEHKDYSTMVKTYQDSLKLNVLPDMWTNTAAGIIIVDDAIENVLLFRRSEDVNSAKQWANPGGTRNALVVEKKWIY